MTQSILHSTLSSRSLSWLSSRSTGRGIRGAVEVQVDEGYVADAVALCSFQSRLWNELCVESNRDPRNINDDVVCLFESKVSRPDFLKTFGQRGNRHAPIATFHWCVTPRGLCETTELPDFWGLLEQQGAGLRVVRHPKYQQVDLTTIHFIGYQILWTDRVRGKRNDLRRPNDGVSPQ
jgi:hypothetical protein